MGELLEYVISPTQIREQMRVESGRPYPEDRSGRGPVAEWHMSFPTAQQRPQAEGLQNVACLTVVASTTERGSSFSSVRVGIAGVVKNIFSALAKVEQ
eukprot:2042706-Amphidinium_carterae.2